MLRLRPIRSLFSMFILAHLLFVCCKSCIIFRSHRTSEWTSSQASLLVCKILKDLEVYRSLKSERYGWDVKRAPPQNKTPNNHLTNPPPMTCELFKYYSTHEPHCLPPRRRLHPNCDIQILSKMFSDWTILTVMLSGTCSWLVVQSGAFDFSQFVLLMNMLLACLSSVLLLCSFFFMSFEINLWYEALWNVPCK